MTSLSTTRMVDPILTNVAIGYRNAKYVGDALFPIIPVDKEQGKIPKWGTESFRIYNTRRQIRSKTNRVDFDPITVPYMLEEEALEVAIDDREYEESAGVLQLEMSRTRMLTDNIRLKMEKDQADAAQNQANYASGHTLALSGTDKFNDDTSKPVDVIGDARSTVRSKIGVYPNVLMLGVSSFEALKNHPAIIERIKYSQTGVVTAAILAEVFGVESVEVGETVYASKDGVMQDVWGNVAILAYVPPAGVRDIWTPAYGYTLRKKGRPMTTKYRDDTVKSNVVHVADVYGVQPTAMDAGFLIQNTV
ncbi:MULTISPECIES: major capsid protein [Paenibacillaceae]|uniref:Phage capsid protein n=2 Tax=Paenibacillaceae TaxID=186822 RepID=A0A511VB28_9BACL|nr:MULTISPECIES: major capsid protein [Paenibacillaceae]MUG72733.1 hypothetical protein [Paenibacillus validus]GEN36125.1 hypothetical protein ADA01nite_35850 [Aneurinibacillus danicus]